MYYAFFWAWKLEAELIPVGLVCFLHLGIEGGSPLWFSEWLMKISGSLVGLKKIHWHVWVPKFIKATFGSSTITFSPFQ